MKAIILAAGLGTRLGDLTTDIPKCLVKILNKTILEHQIDTLNKVGIKNEEIFVVIGNEGECWAEENKNRIKEYCDNVIINYNNTTTKNTYSLRLALKEIKPDELLIIDGDLIFNLDLARKVILKNENLIVSIDNRINKIAGNKVIIDTSGKVKGVGRDIISDLVYIGMMKINKFNFYNLINLINNEKTFNLDTGYLINELSKQDNIYNITDDGLVNVNTPEDILKSEKIWRNNFVVIMSGNTAVGKSTIAKKISTIPNTDIFHSAFIRKELNLTPKIKEEADKFFDFRNNLRYDVDKKVYNLLAERAEESLSNGRNVVLDAGFFFNWQRDLIYNKTYNFNPEMFIVKILCEDEYEIKRRLKKREQNFNESPLNETPSWNTYLVSKEITEPIERDLLQSKILLNILEFDTLKKEFKINEKINETENLREIKKSITGQK